MIEKRPRVFYGWLIVLVCAIGLFLGAPLMIFSFSVFFKSLVVDFHASRAAVSFAFSLFNTVGALWLPGTGMLIDRFGAKRVILVSTLLYGMVLCSALWVGSGLWQLYLLFSILGIAMASGPAPVSYGVVISHWFNRHRGLALGLSMMGIGVGAVVVPILTQRLIAHFGWRMMFAIFGGAILLMPLPVVSALLQNDPEQRGLRPDGDEETPVSHLPRPDKQGLSWHEIWHSSTFWIMICIFSLAGASVHGAVLHMSAIFTDRAISAERAAIATSFVGAAVMVGRLGSGFLLDHFFAPRVAILFLWRSDSRHGDIRRWDQRKHRFRCCVSGRARHGSRGGDHGLHDQSILRPARIWHRFRARLRGIHDRRSRRRDADGRWIRPLSFLRYAARGLLRGNGLRVGPARPPWAVRVWSRTRNDSPHRAGRTSERSVGLGTDFAPLLLQGIH